MMRKIKGIILGVTMMSMVGGMAMPANLPSAVTGINVVKAENITYKGKCGDHATYKYDKDTRTLTISGTGDIWDDAGFARSLYDTESIVIENGIKTVGSNNFTDMYYLKSISIPESVTTIKSKAFSYVEGEVEIPKTVTRIEKYAFDGADEYVIRGDVSGYGYEALGRIYSQITLYGDAKELTKAIHRTPGASVILAEENNKCTIKNGCLLSADGTQLYYYVSKGKQVVIPDTVNIITQAAFSERNIKKITLGKNVTTIGEYAFEDSNVESVVFNSKLKEIKQGAFVRTFMKKAAFKSSVKIAANAFDSKVVISNSKKYKNIQTAVTNAKMKKKTMSISFAKVANTKGYQIRVTKGKKKYTYTTTKNTFSKKAPSKIYKNYNVKINYSYEELCDNIKVKGGAYVTVRPYKMVKGKKSYGKWSAKRILSK